MSYVDAFRRVVHDPIARNQELREGYARFNPERGQSRPDEANKALFQSRRYQLWHIEAMYRALLESASFTRESRPLLIDFGAGSGTSAIALARLFNEQFGLPFTGHQVAIENWQAPIDLYSEYLKDESLFRSADSEHNVLANFVCGFSVSDINMSELCDLADDCDQVLFTFSYVLNQDDLYEEERRSWAASVRTWAKLLQKPSLLIITDSPHRHDEPIAAFADDLLQEGFPGPWSATRYPKYDKYDMRADGTLVLSGKSTYLTKSARNLGAQTISPVLF